MEEEEAATVALEERDCGSTAEGGEEFSGTVQRRGKEKDNRESTKHKRKK